MIRLSIKISFLLCARRFLPTDQYCNPCNTQLANFLATQRQFNVL